MQDLDVFPGQGVPVGAMLVQVSAGCFAVRGGAMEVAWGSVAGRVRQQNLVVEAEEREGWTPLDRPLPGLIDPSWADTVVSLDREVVSGHAYAILAPHVGCGWCGKDKPAFVSVDGVCYP